MNLKTQRKLITILCAGLLLVLSVFAQQSEYTMKAVFLEHFTRFIEWPETSGLADATTPFYVAVIGENPFGSILDQIYAEQKIKNKEVRILYVSTPAEIPHCHILFISNSHKELLPEILSRTKKKPILTVGDTKGFAEDGVLINFYLAENKIKFEINEKAVHDSGLVMSYRLLSLARIVYQGKAGK